MCVIMDVIRITEGGRELLSQMGKNVSVSRAEMNTSAVRTTEIKAWRCPEATAGDGLTECQLLEGSDLHLEDLLV